jgi:hypothetical protein
MASSEAYASERVVTMLKRWGPEETGPVFHREDGSPYQTAIWTTSTLLFANFSSSQKTSCYTRFGIRSEPGWGSRARTPSPSCGRWDIRRSPFHNDTCIPPPNRLSLLLGG